MRDVTNSAAASPSASVQWTIGDVATTITSRDPELTLTTPPAVARFATNQVESHISVDARWAVAGAAGLVGCALRFGRALAAARGGPTAGVVIYLIQIRACAVQDRRLRPDFSSGTVSLHRPYFDASAPMYPLEYPLDELIVTNWLALGRGVEIHACAVRDVNGAGYLFAGHSGAGKSTIARLWRRQPGVTVLSDDRVILRREGDRIWMYGTPWHGDEPLSSPASAPLTHGFFLHHASRNLASPVGQARAASSLFACSFPPFYSASGLEFTLCGAVHLRLEGSQCGGSHLSCRSWGRAS